MSNETPPQAAVAIRNPKDLLAYLTKAESAIKMALPAHLNSQRMLRLALTAFSTNPQLRQCTAQSILASLVVASQLGLEPGVAGQGYLIPYKGQCTFVPGWQGLVSLLNNTGRATAWTGAVYEGDEWTFQLGSRPRCEHIPGPNYGDPDLLRWVYACGKVNGSEQPVIEAWPMSRVWKHRDRYNKVGAKHYSYAQEEMYARKVVLLQVLKYMPRSIELNNAITAADAAELGQTTRVEDSVVIIDGEPADIPQAKPTFEATMKAIAEVPAQQPAPVTAQPAHPGAEPAPTNTPDSPAAPAKRAVKPKPEAPPHPKDRLIVAGVSFDDFTDWCVSTGRAKGAKDWFAAATKASEDAEAEGKVLTVEEQYGFVPTAFWTAMELDDAGIGKAITLYGATSEAVLKVQPTDK